MQILFRAFLAIYLAHLLADFVFQTSRLVDQKRRGKASGYLLHGLIHYFSAVIIAGFVLRGSLLLPRTHLVILGLTLVHLLLDLAKMQLARKYPLCGGSRAYVSDQFLHFLTVGLAGSDGGQMAVSPDVDHCLVVRAVSIHRIQETQAALGFALWERIQRALLEKASPS